LRVESSAEIILKQTVAKLSKYVDCLSLINIPNGYQDALSNAGPWWMKFISSGLNRKDALLQLKRLDNVLLCAGLRMLIFLEDLDRNLQKDEKLSEIAALLDRLKELENVSFVLAINRNVNLAESGIILRIAEHIEVIPELPRKDIRSIFEMFCENCRTLYTEDIVFLSEKYRSERWGPVNYPDSLHEATGGFDKPVFSIPKLLTGPRLLKQSLRRTWQAWQNLHGEIDFDDLLIVNVLRIAAPEAYDFIHDYIHQLRIAENGKFKDIVKDRTHAALSGMSGEDKPDNGQDIISLFNNYVKEVTWNKKAAYNLLEILFPGVSSWGSNTILEPQRIVREYNSADYWIRLNAEELDETEDKDQNILHIVENWRKKEDANVFQGYTLAGAMLYDDDVAEKIEDFGVILSDDEVKKLSEQLFTLILKGQGKRKNPIGLYDDYPGFIELWRLAQKRSINNYDEWLLQEIKKALPVNLRFANDLIYYWCSDRLVGKLTKLRNNIISESKYSFRDSESLLSAIDPDYVWCVYHFIDLCSQPKYGGNGYKPEDWTWLADILLDAGLKNPDVAIPQIVYLVCQRKMGREEYIYRFNDENADKLFGQRYPELMKLLSNDINAPSLREEDKEFIKFAQQQAKSWLAEHDNDNKN